MRKCIALSCRLTELAKAQAFCFSVILQLFDRCAELAKVQASCLKQLRAALLRAALCSSWSSSVQEVMLQYSLRQIRGLTDSCIFCTATCMCSVPCILQFRFGSNLDLRRGMHHRNCTRMLPCSFQSVHLHYHGHGYHDLSAT